MKENIKQAIEDNMHIIFNEEDFTKNKVSLAIKWLNGRKNRNKKRGQKNNQNVNDFEIIINSSLQENKILYIIYLYLGLFKDVNTNSLISTEYIYDFPFVVLLSNNKVETLVQFKEKYDIEEKKKFEIILSEEIMNKIDENYLFIDSIKTFLGYLDDIDSSKFIPKIYQDGTKKIPKTAEKATRMMKFYRGHSNYCYSNLPGVFRETNGVELIKYEKKLYYEFLMRKTTEFTNCKTVLENLSLMQHYGLPTRLLDVTTNPLIALYFACNENESNIGKFLIFCEYSSKIKYIDSHKVKIASCMALLSESEKEDFLDNENSEQILNRIRNEEVAFEDKIDYTNLDELIFVKVNYNNNIRVSSQFGLFAISADHKNFKDKINEKLLEKAHFYISPNSKKRILKELNLLGINQYTVYQTLNDTATYLKENIQNI